MSEQHDRPKELTADEVQVQLEELRTMIEAGVRRITLRVDHVVGHHDFERQEGCPSCV